MLFCGLQTFMFLVLLNSSPHFSRQQPFFLRRRLIVRMATNSRESRRRKILERGSDRLAFISGRFQDLPSQSHDQTDSHPPQPLAHLPHDQDLPPNFSSQAAVSPDAHDKASGPVLLKHDLVFDAGQNQTSASSNGGISDGSILQRGGTSIEPLKDPAFDASGEVNSLPYSLDEQSSLISTSGAAQRTETRIEKHNFFSAKKLSSAIDASEKMRLLCSVTVAVLVVLSHLGFPLIGNRLLGSIISFRPLYFILLTNLTMVIARLLFDDVGGSERVNREENKDASIADYNWTEQLSKTLEVGFVAQKVIDAVFMDCSVYAIIVICGLSLT